MTPPKSTPACAGATVLITQLQYNAKTLELNLDGFSHEETLRRPGDDGAGSTLNWVVGHVVAARGTLHQALGLSPVLTDQEKAPYNRGSAGEAGDHEVLSLDRLKAALQASQSQLLGALSGLTEDDLAAPAPFSFLGRDDETLATLLAALVFHETYHVGQTGMLRRLLGRSEGGIP